MLRKLITIMLVGLFCVPATAFAGDLPDAPSAIKQSESLKTPAGNLQLPEQKASVAPKIAKKKKVQDWQNLGEVRPGDRVRVMDTDLGVKSGEFVAFSEADLTLRAAAGNNLVLPREQVYRVTVLGRGRGRNVKRGMLIGAGAGAAFGGTMIAAEVFDEDRTTGDRVFHEIGKILAIGVTIGLAAGGAGIGAFTGAVIPPETEVYRSAEKPKAVASAQNTQNKQ